MHIARSLFEPIQSRIISSRKIVVIYGARQVGKTTLVHRVLQDIPLRKLLVKADQQQYIDVLSSRDLRNALETLFETTE